MDILRLRDIRKRPLVLDGAFGSCLQEKYQTSFDSLWTSVLNIMNFEAVVNLHKDYIEAGADIITTNTFRTNPVAIKNSKMNISNVELIKKGVKLAIEARGKNRIIIAASNAPAEDCYQVERTISKQELESNHKFHIDNLMKFGCDVIWNETLSHFDEIDIISSYCYENKIPYVINLYFTDELKILSGENILDVIDSYEGVVYSTDEIVGFLNAYAKEAPLEYPPCCICIPKFPYPNGDRDRCND